VGVSVKAFIDIYNKLGPCNIPLACIFMPFPPLPLFKIQIENNIMKFGKLIDNAMHRELMLHLSDPTCGVRAIKFIDLNWRRTGVKMKVGFKKHRMGRTNTI
jgi:hypothetical protein